MIGDPIDWIPAYAGMTLVRGNDGSPQRGQSQPNTHALTTP